MPAALLLVLCSLLPPQEPQAERRVDETESTHSVVPP